METEPGNGGEEVPDQGTQEPSTEAPTAPEQDDGGGDAGTENTARTEGGAGTG